jgi:hypothetical protein
VQHQQCWVCVPSVLSHLSCRKVHLPDDMPPLMMPLSGTVTHSWHLHRTHSCWVLRHQQGWVSCTLLTLPCSLRLSHLFCREVDLPEDAFTDDVSAKVDQRKLTITIARRDPEGPAMQVSEFTAVKPVLFAAHGTHSGEYQQRFADTLAYCQAGLLGAPHGPALAQSRPMRCPGGGG